MNELVGEDMVAVLEGTVSPGAQPLVAKLADMVNGEAVLDERQRYKRPDWTYADSPVVISTP